MALHKKMLVTLDTVVLNHLTRLGANVRQIGVSSDISQRVAIAGSDELAGLAEEINGMLDTLEKSQHDVFAREAQLRQITDNMLDMVSQTDARGIIQYASPSTETFLGYRPEDIIGTSILNHVHPDDLNRIMATFQTVIKASLPGKQEFRFRHSDGHYLWLDAVSKTLIDDEGTVTGAIFSSRDITGRKMLEDSLREREELLSQITDNMVDIIVKVDTEGTLRYISPSYPSVMGYAIEDRLGGSCFEIIHPDDAERVRFIYRKGAKGQVKTDKAEYRMRHADGHYLWLESTGKALRDDRDRFAGFVICLRDITERKQAEISLHRSQEHFRALFESAPVGIVITRSGKILSANHAFRNMLDLKDPAELADQPLTEYMAPNYRQEILERLSNLERDANAPRLLEALGLKKDGSTFSVYIELSRLDLLNAAPAVVAFISDITERK